MIWKSKLFQNKSEIFCRLIERERMNSVQPEVRLRDDEFTVSKSEEKEPEYRLKP